MKFTYLAFFCCALWTLVSALPLVLLGSESTPRGSDQRVEHRSLYARTTGPRRNSGLAGQFIVETSPDHAPAREAKKLHIPIIAIVDTNHSPEGIDHVIPGNDDAVKCLKAVLCRSSGK